MSDTTIYEPEIRVLLGTASHFCEAIVLELGTVPKGTTLGLRILQVVRRGAQAMYNQFDKRGAAVTPLRGDVGGAQAKLSASKQQKNCANPTQAMLYSNGEPSRCVSEPLNLRERWQTTEPP